MVQMFKGSKVQRCKDLKVQSAMVQRCKIDSLKKIRWQTSRQTDRQTNRVTSSLLELLVAAKNVIHYTQVWPELSKAHSKQTVTRKGCYWCLWLKYKTWLLLPTTNPLTMHIPPHHSHPLFLLPLKDTPSHQNSPTRITTSYPSNISSCISIGWVGDVVQSNLRLTQFSCKLDILAQWLHNFYLFWW